MQALSMFDIPGRYPVHIWKDAESSKLRMDTYNHTNSLITTKVRLPSQKGNRPWPTANNTSRA